MGLDPAGNAHIGTTRAAIEMLSDKLGWVLMTLGGMLLQPVCLLSHPQPQTREGSPAPVGRARRRSARGRAVRRLREVSHENPFTAD